MAKSNCIVFAVLLYRRRKAKGKEGYILCRQSRLGHRVGHWLYAERRQDGRLRTVHYTPVVPRPVSCLPPPWFEGSPRWGDLN